jgi:hypothetical protein
MCCRDGNCGRGCDAVNFRRGGYLGLVDAQTRLELTIAQTAHAAVLETGYAIFFDESLVELAAEAGASEQDARQVGRQMLEEYLLVENQARAYSATPRLLLLHEARDRQEAYLQNAARRYVLEEVGRNDAEGGATLFKEAEGGYTQARLFAAAQVLDHLDLVHFTGGIPTHFALKLTSDGYSTLKDERLLRTKLPVNATEDEEAHAHVAPDALRQVITSCEQMLEQNGWRTALTNIRNADNEYADGNWVNAVRDYYAALESGLKFALHEEGATYGEGNALKKLAARSAQTGLIPANYQPLFAFTDSIRSPRSHGAGPNEPVAPVEIGQAEALLIGNLVRSLLLYVGNRPAVS